MRSCLKVTKGSEDTASPANSPQLSNDRHFSAPSHCHRCAQPVIPYMDDMISDFDRRRCNACLRFRAACKEVQEWETKLAAFPVRYNKHERKGGEREVWKEVMRARQRRANAEHTLVTPEVAWTRPDADRPTRLRWDAKQKHRPEHSYRRANLYWRRSSAYAPGIWSAYTPDHVDEDEVWAGDQMSQADHLANLMDQAFSPHVSLTPLFGHAWRPLFDTAKGQGSATLLPKSSSMSYIQVMEENLAASRSARDGTIPASLAVHAPRTLKRSKGRRYSSKEER